MFSLSFSSCDCDLVLPIAPIHSLAVLPLENVSGDVSQEYFADGMTDELITTLGQISALRVISRTSAMLYKGARKPLAQIARELDVDAVVDGAVFRSGNQVRITAEIIDARNDDTSLVAFVQWRIARRVGAATDGGAGDRGSDQPHS